MSGPLFASSVPIVSSHRGEGTIAFSDVPQFSGACAQVLQAGATQTVDVIGTDAGVIPSAGDIAPPNVSVHVPRSESLSPEGRGSSDIRQPAIPFIAPSFQFTFDPRKDR